MSHRSEIRWLPVSTLVIDPKVQKKMNLRWIASHVEEFDPEKLGYPTLSERSNGDLVVVDGQHRVELTKRALGNDQAIECEVFSGLTLQEEAGLFLDRADRLAVRTIDKFRLQVVSADPVACDIVEVTKALGITIGPPSNAQVGATKTLEYIYNGGKRRQDGGRAALHITLRTLRRAWPYDQHAMHTNLIKGLGEVYLAYGESVEHARMIDKLPAAGTPQNVMALGQRYREIRRKEIGYCVAGAIVDIYNRDLPKSSSRRLQEWWH